MIADLRETLEMTFRQTLVAEFELQVWNNSRQVCVASALAQTVERALNMSCTTLHGGKRIGHCTARVIVTMNADYDVGAHVATNISDDFFNFVWQ